MPMETNAHRATCEELETTSPEGFYVVAGISPEWRTQYDVETATLEPHWMRYVANVRSNTMERPLGVSLIVERKDNRHVVYVWMRI